jgi:lysophospholipase L1-like esterase
MLRTAAKAKPVNDYKTATWGQPIRTNALGFREREVPPKSPGVCRIIVLGDSLTWGPGLPESERYSAVLESLLQQEGQPVEVLNFALAGAPTTIERDTLLKHMDAVQPDLVVFGWCINDTQPKSQDWCPEREAFEKKLDSLRSAGLKKVADGMYYLGPDWMEALDRTYQPDSAEWIAFTGALADIARACRERKLPAPIYALLLQGDGDFNHPDRTLAKILEWSHKAGEAAEKAGFTVVSMEERFKAEGSRKRWVNPWDGHPDAQCNRVYAEELAKAIAERIGSAISRRAPQG